MNTPSPKEAQIKEQYDNTEPSGKAEQDAIKEAPDLDWLDDILEAVRIGGWYDANPDARENNYLDTDVAKERIAQHIAEQVEAARIEALEALLLTACPATLHDHAKNEVDAVWVGDINRMIKSPIYAKQLKEQAKLRREA